MKKILACFLLIPVLQNLRAQGSPLQDPSLNNLVHPGGYITGNPGELGAVQKAGSGKHSMILIPGLGFGADALGDLVKTYQKNYTVYTVTPAGFNGTPAPPMPPAKTSYAELSWTNGIVTGILALIEKEKLDRPVIVAHFVTGTQVALNLALNHHDKIGKVVILSGSPYRYYPSQKDNQWSDWATEKTYTVDQRARLADFYWAPQWFKTVTKKTWDANMWTPSDYSKDSLTGERFFKTSAAVSLQVMIRYLVEYMVYDANERLLNLQTPVLVLVPDFNGLLSDSSKQYLTYFHQAAWQKASGNVLIQVKKIPGTRICMWCDNPAEVYGAINTFLKEK